MPPMIGMNPMWAIGLSGVWGMGMGMWGMNQQLPGTSGGMMGSKKDKNQKSEMDRMLDEMKKKNDNNKNSKKIQVKIPKNE